MTKHQPREGDRVKFNPAGTDTVVEGIVRGVRARYGRRRGLAFQIDGVLAYWTADPECADFEHFLAENFVITKRQYQVGDGVDADDLEALPISTGVSDGNGHLWQKTGANDNYWSGAFTDTGAHGYRLVEAGPVRIVHLP